MTCFCSCSKLEMTYNWNVITNMIIWPVKPDWNLGIGQKKSRYWPKLSSHQKLQRERVSFQVFLGCFQILPSLTIELRTLFSCWLPSGGSQPLEADQSLMLTSPLYGPQKARVFSHTDAKKWILSVPWMNSKSNHSLVESLDKNAAQMKNRLHPCESMSRLPK